MTIRYVKFERLSLNLLVNIIIGIVQLIGNEYTKSADRSCGNAVFADRLSSSGSDQYVEYATCDHSQMIDSCSKAAKVEMNCLLKL